MWAIEVMSGVLMANLARSRRNYRIALSTIQEQLLSWGSLLQEPLFLPNL